MSEEKQRYSISDWGLLALLAFIWGFSFFFIKKGLESFSAYQVGALRIFISFCAFFPFLFIRRWEIPWKKIIPIILVGIFGSGLPPFLFAKAEENLSSSVTGILNSTTPVFALILGALFFGIAVNVKKISGVILGMIGSVMIIIFTGDGSLNVDFKYGIMVIIATFCYGLSGNLLKKYIQGEHPLLVSVLAFMFIGPIAGVYLATTDFITVIKTAPKAYESLGYIAILAILGTATALFIFNHLVIRTNALFASTVTFLIPVVAVVIGLLTGETLGLVHIAGLILIMSGVLITSRG
ncbi:MAG: DMT family transporter [Chitinophagales bacterium]|nr:DMT family transporter [Chitinophagales bacterium]